MPSTLYHGVSSHHLNEDENHAMPNVEVVPRNIPQQAQGEGERWNSLFHANGILEDWLR